MSDGINTRPKAHYKNGLGAVDKATRQYHESIQPGPAVAHASIWSPNQMVSMSDLVTEGDDDFAEFFTYEETSSPINYQYPLQHEPLKKTHMNQTTTEPVNVVTQNQPVNNQVVVNQESLENPDEPGNSKLEQKLKEVDTFVQNYSGQSAPRPDPIWNKTDMVSMDDLIAFDEDLGEELESENKEPEIEPVEVRVQPEVIQEIKTKPILNEKPKSKVLDAGFDASEALSMLINIQSTQDDKKFDLLDGFLDKYKISPPKKTQPEPTRSSFYASPSEPKYDQVFVPKQARREPEVSPFCVRNQTVQPSPRRSANSVNTSPYSSSASPQSMEQTSFTTFDAIQNVQVRESCPTPAQSSLDNLISSNRTNNEKKDYLYWQRRRINNEAAHRSRAKRKQIIEEKSNKIEYFEAENPKLRNKLDGVLNELDALKRKLAFFQKLEAQQNQ